MAYLTSVSSARIPSFIKEDSPNFVAFMKAYYYWLSAQRTELKNALDVDNTTDEFLKHFMKQYLYALPDTIASDKRFFIKHAREFFGAKGSETAIKLLFRLLYQDDPTIEYPYENVLNVSSTTWTNTISIKVTSNDTEAHVNQLSGVVLKQGNETTAVVETVVKSIYNSAPYYEVFLSSGIGTFTTGTCYGVTTTGLMVTLTILPICESVDITSAGAYYIPGDTITSAGGDGVALSCVVNEVTRGHIETVTITNGGLGYAVGDTITDVNINSRFKAIVTTVSGPGAITGIKIINAGWGYYTRPELTIDTLSGINAVLRPNGTTIGGVKSVKFYDFGIGYTVAPSLTVVHSQPVYAGDNEVASVSITLGTMCRYPGEYSRKKSLLNDISSVIHGGDKYQPFSYIIKSSQSLSQYRDVLKNLVHPAGMIVFGQVLVDTRVNLEMYGGIIGEINSSLPDGHKKYRDIILYIISTASSSMTAEQISELHIYIDAILSYGAGAVQSRIDGWKFKYFYTRTIKSFQGETIRMWEDDIVTNPEVSKKTDIMPDAEYFNVTAGPTFTRI